MLFDLWFKFDVSDVPTPYGPFALLTSGDDVEVTSHGEKQRTPPSLGSGCVSPGVLRGLMRVWYPNFQIAFQKKKKKSHH